MSQRSVERALGKLVTDRTFRERFFDDPPAAALRAGLELSSEEMDALARVPAAFLTAFEQCIDDRICRLAIPAERTRPS